VAIPDFQTLMRPILVQLQDGQPRAIADVRTALVSEFSLTEEELAHELPSGRAKTFQNRVGWATTHLYRTGLLTRPRRSVYAITERGQQVLAANPERVDLRVLAQFPELAAFRAPRLSAEEDERPDQSAQTLLAVEALSVEDETPQERIASAYRELRAALIAEVLDSIRDQDSGFFEKLVLDVLQAMGYGGSRDDAAERLGQSGDEGVDGVIREDRLGLDQIYVQAKKWADPVGRPEIQKFFGALHGQRATKGVFITTSSFTRGARDFANDVTPRVILVDGRELAGFMIDYGVGVTPTETYTLVRLDSDYFDASDASVT
jgi:restriction system protein